MSDEQGNDTDDQDIAEAFDEELVGMDAPAIDEPGVDFPPERPRGVRFADADVTDESVADRAAQENPEVWVGEDEEPSEDEVTGRRAEIPVDPTVLDDIEVEQP